MENVILSKNPGRQTDRAPEHWPEEVSRWHGDDRLPENLKSGLKSSHLPGLDSIRAAAALLVVLYHFGIADVSGGLGVLMFFVLSGFLITWLLIKENERAGTVSLRNFYIRRSLRIFPAFYCYAALVLGLMIVSHRPVLWPQAVASLLYVNNYYQAIHGHITSGFSHTWSLGVEEQFYLLWPVLFLIFGRNYRRMATILCALIVTFWIYRGVLFFGFHAPEVYLYEAFDARADHLLIGCLLAVVLKAGLAAKFWRSVCAAPWLALLAVSLLVMSNAAEVTYGHAYRDTLGNIVNPVLTALIVAQTIAFAKTKMWSWLNWGWITYLGRISYSIYLYQAVLMGYPKRILASFPVPVQLAGSITAVIVVASISYFVVEKPFLALKDRFNNPHGAETHHLRTAQVC